MQRAGLARLLLPVVYAAGVFAVVSAGAAAVWHPTMHDGFTAAGVGVLPFAMPHFYALVWTAGVAGVAAGLAAVGTVIGFALFGRVSWRAMHVVGLINGMLGGLLLLDAANTGVDASSVTLAPIVPLEAGVALAPVLSVALILAYHFLLRPLAGEDCAGRTHN